MKLRMVINDQKLLKQFTMKMYGGHINGRIFDVHETKQLVKCVDFLRKIKIPYMVCHAYLGEEKFYERVFHKQREETKEPSENFDLEVIVF